ncbi:Hypothetical protein HVR_LOCUS368 [uncultured virus]|nr:Hypothetical protein HVR_LOCUS368 [uncultured virus]
MEPFIETKMATTKLIAMYVPVSPNDKSGSDMCDLYSSMDVLWKNRDKHKIFIVANFLPGAKLGLSALKKYCKESGKTLLIDVHKQHPILPSLPDLVIIIDDKGTNDPDKLVPDYQESIIVLENYMYDSLLNMAKMGLGGLYHEVVPIHYNNEKARLESIYGDIVYISK